MEKRRAARASELRDEIAIGLKKKRFRSEHGGTFSKTRPPPVVRGREGGTISHCFFSLQESTLTGSGDAPMPTKLSQKRAERRQSVFFVLQCDGDDDGDDARALAFF